LLKLLTVSEARSILLKNFHILDGEIIQIDRGLDRILMNPIFANLSMPPFDNSSMDGFALRSINTRNATLDKPIILEVVADIPAGVYPDVTIRDGQCARIVTGAMIPDGADAVIPVEKTNHAEFVPGAGLETIVKVFSTVNLADNIRPLGQDFIKGDMLIGAKKRLRPQDIGVIAMQGIDKILVYRKPRVGLVSSGDELLEPGELWLPGKIYNSNTFTLNALLNKNGCECINLGSTTDSKESIRRVFDRAVDAKVDIILTSAGVSMGAFDFVRTVIEQDGNLTFWKVNMRPGKPLVFGSYKGIPLIGLPGNPVSAYIGFVVFVRIVINKISGRKNSVPNYVSTSLLHEIESDGRESYLRAIVTEDNGVFRAKTVDHQGSGNLMSLVTANALIIIPAGVKYLPSGADVQAWFLDGENR
jgi:molybdopterin molybdotransferase